MNTRNLPHNIIEPSNAVRKNIPKATTLKKFKLMKNEGDICRIKNNPINVEAKPTTGADN